MASWRPSPAWLVQARRPQAGRGVLSQSRSTTRATGSPHAVQVPRRTSCPFSIFADKSRIVPASRQVRHQTLPSSMACSLGGIRSQRFLPAGVKTGDGCSARRGRRPNLRSQFVTSTGLISDQCSFFEYPKPLFRQSVSLVTTTGLIRDGHFYQARFQGWNQIGLPEVILMFES
jgi:hypothetical protein